MECSHCYKQIEDEGKMVLLTIDGDFACDDNCKVAYEKERDHFFNYICQSAERTEAWLLGKPTG